jgi:hypothetical protein
MQTRRSFFKKIAAAVAVVAIAPRMAFSAKPLAPVVPAVPAPVVETVPFWYQTSRRSRMVTQEYLDVLASTMTRASIVPITPKQFEEVFATK